MLLAASIPTVSHAQTASITVDIQSVTQSDTGALTIRGLNFRSASTGIPQVRVNGVVVPVASSTATTIVTGDVVLAPGAYGIRVTQTYIGNYPRSESFAVDEFELTVGVTGPAGAPGLSTTFLGSFAGTTYDGAPTGCTNGGAAYATGSPQVRSYVCHGANGANGAPGASATVQSLAGQPCTLPGNVQGTTQVSTSYIGMISIRCVDPAPPTIPSDYFAIGSPDTAGPYVMVDVLPCLSVGFGTPCGRVYTALGSDLAAEQQRPSYFNYDVNLDTLQYHYNGPYETIAAGTWCLIALDANRQTCSVSDCAELSVVRIQDATCRDFPNTRRFQVRVDPATSEMEIVVSSSNTATQPRLLLRTSTGPLELGLPAGGDFVNVWRREFPVP